MMTKYLIRFTSLLLPSLLMANLPYPFPQMVPEEYMEPGFHRSVDAGAFPNAMRNARRDYSRMINDADADSLFEQRTFTGSRVFQGEGSFSTQTLNYEIMYPHPDAVTPPGGFPLVFTTYGRGRLAEAMALDHFRENHPAYVVAFLHGERPGPLHAPPVHLDFANLFLELFDWLFDEYNIDQNRVYGSGWSRGGSSMTILSHAYAQRPDYDGIPLITAAVPSAGGFQDLLDNAVESIKDVKWFSLQGADDGNSNPRGSEFAFDQLEKVGALENVFWWIEGTGHSPHSVGWNVAEIVEWMFAQTKADLLVRPVAVLDINVTDAGVPLTFTANASDSTPNNDGSITGYTWQLFKSQEAIADYSNRPLHGWTLDTGFQGAPVIGTGASVTYTLDEPGTWWLRVIVEDDEGNRRAATQEIDARAVIPAASFTFTRNHEVAGQSIHFDAGDSEAEFGATISSYSWDFGDGNTASGEAASHAFATAGEYEVELTVTSSEGQTHSRVQTVTVTEAFPGYRYFRFVGLTCHHTYRAPTIHSFAFRTGATVFPREPMTSNVSQGITLDATWNADTVWRAFDQDTDSGWSHHNYFTPGGWTMDVGENQRFVPSGVNMRMRSGNDRWTDFDVEASVDGEIWDTIWSRRFADDGYMSTAGEEILFADMPFIELNNIEDGGVFGLGTAFALQAELTHMEDVTGVEYFANGISIGTATSGPDYELAWTPSELGEYTLTAVATFDSGARSQTTWFPVNIEIQPASVLDRIDLSPQSIRVYPEASVQMEAVAYDQYDLPLDPQPSFSWNVVGGDGVIDSEGLFTAGETTGTFSVEATASFEGITLTGTQPVIVVDADNFCREYFAGEVLRPVWDFVSLEPWPGARADVDNGQLIIQSRGANMWQATQEFSVVRRTDITGDFDVSVKVISQNDPFTHNNSKLGIIAANNFDDPGQGGFVMVNTRGDRRVALQSEGSTPGQFGGSSPVNFPEDADWPVWLRLVKEGTAFTAYYKFAKEDAWVSLGTQTVALSAENVQVALFASSNNATETIYGIFGDFIIADCDPNDFVLVEAPPVITQQPSSVSTFEGRTVSLSASATGFPLITGYQWSRNGIAISDDSRISGSQTAVLTIDDAELTDSGEYTLAVTNEEGTTTTDPATVEVLPTPELYLLIDFGTNHTAPGQGWNSFNNAASHSGLVHGITLEETDAVVEMITTGGSGIQTSGNTDAWGTRFVAPGWANEHALNDRLWVSNGHTATLRFRNLDPEKSYTLEIASGFAGSGDNGNEPGIFEVVGAGGSVAGVNAHNGDNLGVQVHWTSRGPNDGGNPPYAVEGWMVWENVTPNAEGQIDVLLSTVSSGTARVSLNAARFFEVPDTAVPGPEIQTQPEGASLVAGENHTFTVVANGEGDLSYQWFKDGTLIDGANAASLTLNPVGVADSGSYSVQVSDDNGTTVSGATVLKVSGIELNLITPPLTDPLLFGQSLGEAVFSGGEVQNPSGESVNGTFAFVDGAFVPDAGEASYMVRFTPEDDFNYEPLDFSSQLLVDPAPVTFQFSELSQVYSGQELAPQVETEPLGVNVEIDFTGIPTAVGDYPFTVEVTDSNYTGSDSETLTITPAPLEVTAEDQIKGLSEADPELTWAITGGELLGGDEFAGELSRESGEAVGTYAIQQGTLTAGGNYDLTFVEGTLTIVEFLEFTLSYNANGGTGPVPDSETADSGTEVTVAFSPEPTREGFTFLGWKTDPSGLTVEFPLGESATVLLEEDTVLYAHWLSPWTLFEDFEKLALGNISGQNGWSAQTHSLVVEGPEDGGNQAFSFRPGGSNNSASKSLPQSVDDGESATFFFRFNIPAGSSSFNQQIRFSDLNTFRIAFNGGNDSVFSIFYDGMGSGNSNVGIDQTIARDTWYKVWAVLDGATSTYEIYIEGGEYETPTRVTTADDDPEKYVYAEQTTNTISQLTWIGWSGNAVLFDDVYVFPGGKSLDDPRPQTVQDPYEAWLIRNQLQDTDPVEHEGWTFDARTAYGFGLQRENGTSWTGAVPALAPVSASPSGGMTLQIEGNPGRWYQLEARDNLMDGDEDWVPVSTLESGNGVNLEFPADLPQQTGTRFYRVRVLTEGE
jgi:hypothetical protein